MLADAIDALRYQTVYAARPGAVAAPTAGLALHGGAADAPAATPASSLRTSTLHVGAGTFQPVRVERIADHRMHSERYEISEPPRRRSTARSAERRRVVAVGTTSLRALESAVDGSDSASACRRARNCAFHHAGLSLSRCRSAADKLSLAEVDAADARLSLRRYRAHSRGVCACDRSSAIAFSVTATPCCSSAHR